MSNKHCQRRIQSDKDARQKGCHVSHAGLVPREQMQRALSILNQLEILSPDGPEAGALGKQYGALGARYQQQCCKGCTDGGGAGRWA